MENFILEGNISVKAAILGGVRDIQEVIVDKNKKDRDTTWILYRAKERHIPIRLRSREEINAMAQGHTHGGILCICTERRYQTLAQCDHGESCFFALIEGVEDPFNFGSVLRTLYASGCDGIIYPKRDWQNATSIIVKGSAGASEYLPQICYEDSSEILRELQARKIELYCAERKNAVNLYNVHFPSRICMAIGGEMRGLSKAIKEASKQNVYIPYGREVRNALNAVSAAAILSFEILRQKQRG